MKTCNNCKYSITFDNGYSNWTVMGTDIACLHNLNPSFPMDLGYELPKELKFADECPNYMEGEPIHIDCDNENGDYENYTDDLELKELVKEYQQRT